MRQLTLEEQHGVELEMLEFVHQFCMREHIEYFLMYGSLLGAVRHGGMIPWDGDIDLGMMRGELDRFIEAFPAALEGTHYRFIAPCDVEHHFGWWAKVLDTRTAYKDGPTTMPSEYGLTLDIFPFDPYAGEWRRKIARMQNKARTAAFFSRFEDKGGPNVAGRGIKRIAKALLAKCPASFYDYDACKRLVRYNGDFDYYLNYKSKKPMLPREYLESFEVVPFEGTSGVLAPVQREAILDLLYGTDWRTPKEYPRHAHIFWRDGCAPEETQ